MPSRSNYELTVNEANEHLLHLFERFYHHEINIFSVQNISSRKKPHTEMCTYATVYAEVLVPFSPTFAYPEEYQISACHTLKKNIPVKSNVVIANAIEIYHPHRIHGFTKKIWLYTLSGTLD